MVKLKRIEKITTRVKIFERRKTQCIIWDENKVNILWKDYRRNVLLAFYLNSDLNGEAQFREYWELDGRNKIVIFNANCKALNSKTL